MTRTGSRSAHRAAALDARFARGATRRLRDGFTALCLSVLSACSTHSGARDADDASTSDVCEPPDAGPSSPIDQCDTLWVYVSVFDDSEPFPLFADAVEFVVPGCEERVACTQRSRASFLCEVPWGAGAAAPDPDARGDYRVTMIGTVQGKAQEAEVNVRHDFRSCAFKASLLLSPPSCVDRDASAVEGTVLGVAEDADLHVSLVEPYKFDGDAVYSRGRLKDCETEGAHYRCPALGYQNNLVLWVTVGDKTLAVRDVYVRDDGCNITQASYEVRPDRCDVEFWLAAEPNPAESVELSITLAAEGDAPFPCESPDATHSTIRCALPATRNKPLGEVTLHSSAGTALAFLYASRCPESPVIFGPGALTGSPRYGVPHRLLGADDMRALGLLQEAE
jgi:hypothetical protein